MRICIFFYNDDDEFNIMKCKYVCGGPSDEGIYKELFEAIHKAYNEIKDHTTLDKKDPLDTSKELYI